MQRVDLTGEFEKDVCLSCGERSEPHLYQDKHTFYRQIIFFLRYNVLKFCDKVQKDYLRVDKEDISVVMIQKRKNRILFHKTVIGVCDKMEI